MGGTWENVDLDVVGGHFTDAATGHDIVLDQATVLHGVVIEVLLGSHVEGISVNPWSHLAYGLGQARWKANKESTYADAMTRTLALLKAHLGFDPLMTT